MSEKDAIDVSQFDSIEIAYTTSDRFGDDQDSDPHMRHVQYVQGAITGINYGQIYADDERREVSLGTLSFAIIDLYEAEELFEVLDSRSPEWLRYLDVVEDDEPATHLMILDRIEIAPEARGHGIGLHALARVIRTWASGQVMVVLTAWPPGAEGDEGKAGSEALVRYWSKLALERVASDGDSPILVGRRWLADDGEVEALSQWEPQEDET
jgi:GNAT superfamily N-acetyltransferase